MYTTLSADGSVTKVCSSAEFDSVGEFADGNKLNVHRFLRLDIPVAGRYTFRFEADAATLALLPPDDPGDPRDQSDPDMFYYQTGRLPSGQDFVQLQANGKSAVQAFRVAKEKNPSK